MTSWLRRVGDMFRTSVFAAALCLGLTPGVALADPEISVSFNNRPVFDGGEVNIGSTRQGRALTRTLTIVNTGSDSLDITNVTIPEGFDLLLPPTDSVGPRRATVLRLSIPASAEPGVLEGDVVIENSDESEPSFTVTIRAEVVPVAPDVTVRLGTVEIPPGDQIDFGATLEGVQVARSLIVTNSGNADLRISGLEVSGSAFRADFRRAVTLKPGRRASFPVRLLAPSSLGPGTFEETLRIVTNDPDPEESSYEVSLRGVVAEAVPGLLLLEGGTLVVPGADVSFGRYLGRAVTRTFTIRNTGRQPLEIGQIVADGLGFDVPLQPRSPILPGRGSRFSVRLLADDPGAAPSATIRIPTNIEGNEEVFITVSAEYSQLGPEVNVTGPRGVLQTTSSIDLGTINTSEQASFTLGISNALGTAALTVTDVQLTGTGFSIVSQPAPSVRAGGATSMRVTYTAGLLPTNATGQLRFSTNDSDEAQFTVNISVVVVAPPSRAAISVAKLIIPEGADPIPVTLSNQELVEFGSTELGTPQDRLFRIINTSMNGDLTVDSIVFQSTVGLFEVSTWFPNGVAPTFPLVLTPGSSLTFALTCPASTAGLNTGRFIVNNNATRVEDRVFTVNLSCDVRTVSGRLEVERSTTPPQPVARMSTVGVGAAVVGSVPITSFTLKNTGVLPLTLGAASSSTGDFVIETQPPTNLAVDGTAPFAIRMVTATPGVKTGIITIPSNEQDGAFTFTASGVVNNWFTVGSGLGPMGSSVRVIQEIDIDGSGAGLAVPYAAGTFTTPGERIARFVSGSWQALPGGGLSGPVNALAAWDNDANPANGVLLVAGGDFTTAGGTSANRVAVWNGATWAAIGPLGSNGVSGVVNALFAHDEDGNAATASVLYIGGRFATAGNGTTVNNMTRWNGTQFFPMGTIPGVAGSPTAQVYAFLPFDPDGSGNVFPPRGIVVAGDFTTAGGVADVNNIFVYFENAVGTQRRINTMGSGVNGAVRCLAYWDPDGPIGGSGTMPIQVVAGGEFTSAGGASADKIAHFGRDPSAGQTPVWNGVKAGSTNGTVNALSVFDEDGAGPDIPTLFAGGSFSQINGDDAIRVARFDSRARAWKALGTGANAAVRAMNPPGINGPGNGVVPVERLFVGGDFSTIGGVSVGFIALWGTAAP